MKATKAGMYLLGVNLLYPLIWLLTLCVLLANFCHQYSHIAFVDIGTLIQVFRPSVKGLKVASSPSHSHVFNVTRRKGGEPGTRHHARDVRDRINGRTDLMSVGTLTQSSLSCPRILRGDAFLVDVHWAEDKTIVALSDQRLT